MKEFVPKVLETLGMKNLKERKKEIKIMDYLKELQDLSFDARHYIKTIVAGSGAFEIFLDDTLCEKLSRDDSNKIREILSCCVDNLFSYIDKIKSEKKEN